jgi:acyl-CoA synthetase (NDP forming)
MTDVLVTLLFMPRPTGRNAALICVGGGASVLKADEFEKIGLRVPQLPRQAIDKILEYTPAAGNILVNPVDYSQGPRDLESLLKTVNIILDWDGIDFLVMYGYRRPMEPPKRKFFGRQPPSETARFLERMKEASKPVALVVEPSILPDESDRIFTAIKECASAGFPVYYSFIDAANAISLVLDHYDQFVDRSS